MQHKSVPQRLKPSRHQGIFGTAKAVPFVENRYLHEESAFLGSVPLTSLFAAMPHQGTAVYFDYLGNFADIDRALCIREMRHERADVAVNPSNSDGAEG